MSAPRKTQSACENHEVTASKFMNGLPDKIL